MPSSITKIKFKNVKQVHNFKSIIDYSAVKDKIMKPKDVTPMISRRIKDSIYAG